MARSVGKRKHDVRFEQKSIVLRHGSASHASRTCTYAILQVGFESASTLCCSSQRRERTASTGGPHAAAAAGERCSLSPQAESRRAQTAPQRSARGRLRRRELEQHPCPAQRWGGRGQAPRERQQRHSPAPRWLQRRRLLLHHGDRRLFQKAPLQTRRQGGLRQRTSPGRREPAQGMKVDQDSDSPGRSRRVEDRSRARRRRSRRWSAHALQPRRTALRNRCAARALVTRRRQPPGCAC
jgi:hypothetical protein